MRTDFGSEENLSHVFGSKWEMDSDTYSHVGGQGKPSYPLEKSQCRFSKTDLLLFRLFFFLLNCWFAKVLLTPFFFFPIAPFVRCWRVRPKICKHFCVNNKCVLISYRAFLLCCCWRYESRKKQFPSTHLSLQKKLYTKRYYSLLGNISAHRYDNICLERKWKHYLKNSVTFGAKRNHFFLIWNVEKTSNSVSVRPTFQKWKNIKFMKQIMRVQV